MCVTVCVCVCVCVLCVKMPRRALGNTRRRETEPVPSRPSHLPTAHNCHKNGARPLDCGASRATAAATLLRCIRKKSSHQHKDVIIVFAPCTPCTIHVHTHTQHAYTHTHTHTRRCKGAPTSTRMRDARSSARAMHSSCRCPTLRLEPPSLIGELRPPSCACTCTCVCLCVCVRA